MDARHSARPAAMQRRTAAGRMLQTALVVLGCCAGMPHAHAAWLHLCAAPVPSGSVNTVVRLPDGTPQWLFLDDTPVHQGCRSSALSVPLDDVVALHPLPQVIESTIGDTLVLRGADTNGRYTITAADNGAAGSSERVPVPFGVDLLPDMTVRAYGTGERADAAIDDSRLTLQCDAGRTRAGALLRGPWYLPQASMKLEWHAGGSGRFRLALTATPDAAHAYRIGRLDAAAGGDSAPLPLPAHFDRQHWQGITLDCPPAKAELQLDSLRLLPQPVAVGTRRSAWVLQADDWQKHPDAALALADKYDARQLFIAIPLVDGQIGAPELLAAFIRQATAQGMQVWSADGDPHMALASEHAGAAARARAYAVYNASHPEAKIAGMQFDVEPYLLPGFDATQSGWEDAYVDLVHALRRATATLPLEVVVPSWWADREPLLNRIAPYVASLCVTDYHTAPTEIVQTAVPFLDWGVAHGKRIRIALEAGPVPAEELRRYTRAAEGELWLLDAEPMPLLLLLKAPHANPAGPAFRLVSRRPVDGSAISFLGDSARLLSVAPTLETEFAAWPSFAGIALHGIHGINGAEKKQ